MSVEKEIESGVGKWDVEVSLKWIFLAQSRLWGQKDEGNYLEKSDLFGGSWEICC